MVEIWVGAGTDAGQLARRTERHLRDGQNVTWIGRGRSLPIMVRACRQLDERAEQLLGVRFLTAESSKTERVFMWSHDGAFSEAAAYFTSRPRRHRVDSDPPADV